MRIHLTNDDGIDSVGLHVLARHVADAGHDVVVVAPDRDWSGASSALGSFDPREALAVRRVEVPGAEHLSAWALDGPPALTVVAARLGAFGEPADLVVSGINAGLNTGRTVLHSGTVGAVLTAQNFGISGLAVSVAASDPWHWDTAAALAVDVLDLVASAPTGSALNLNVPALGPDEVKGVRWARLAPFGAVRAQVRAVDDARVELDLVPTGYDPPDDTDQGCVERGYAALTTLVGVVETWPRPPPVAAGAATHATPGADLEAVHEVPDPSDHRLLRSRLGPGEPAGTA